MPKRIKKKTMLSTANAGGAATKHNSHNLGNRKKSGEGGKRDRGKK